jgi:hypothetical protein
MEGVAMGRRVLAWFGDAAARGGREASGMVGGDDVGPSAEKRPAAGLVPAFLRRSCGLEAHAAVAA